MDVEPLLHTSDVEAQYTRTNLYPGTPEEVRAAYTQLREVQSLMEASAEFLEPAERALLDRINAALTAKGK